MGFAFNAYTWQHRDGHARGHAVQSKACHYSIVARNVEPCSCPPRRRALLSLGSLFVFSSRYSLRQYASQSEGRSTRPRKLTDLCQRARQAEAAEGDVKFLEPGSSIVGRFVEQADGWQKFETLDFQLEVPPGFQFVEAPKQPPPPGRGRGAPPSAIKAIFVGSNDLSVTVVEYSASQIKPTFFQVVDISQYGSASDVAKLLTPPGSQILATQKAILEQPERDTGTVRGKVKAAPQTVYRFEYRLGSGVQVATAAVARAGKVLLVGAVGPSQQWQSQPGLLRRAIESFQLSFPN